MESTTPNQKLPAIKNIILLNSDEGTAAQSNKDEGADGSDVVKEALANQNYVFVPFADGGLFRYRENPNKPGTWVLIDSQNVPVAVTGDKAIADFLCRAAHCLVATIRTMRESKIVAPNGKV